MTQCEAKYYISDIYDEAYGIYNHRQSNALPFSTVSFFPEEDYTENSPWYDYLRRYIDLNIKETWGLSVNEYMDLPMWRTELIDEITKEVNSKKAQTVAKVEKEMNQK
jgi:hypothetical protein